MAASSNSRARAGISPAAASSLAKLGSAASSATTITRALEGIGRAYMGDRLAPCPSRQEFSSGLGSFRDHRPAPGGSPLAGLIGEGLMRSALRHGPSSRKGRSGILLAL